MSYIKSLLSADNILGKIQSGEHSQEVRVQATKGLLQRPKRRSVLEDQTEEIPFQSAYSALDSIQARIDAEKGKEEMPEGTGSNLEVVGVQRPRLRESGGFVPVPGSLDDLASAREALAAVESRGSGDYSALGPLVTKGMYKNQRAYGRYQVMEGNIGPWTKEVFGQPMTKEDFLSDPAAQDAVVEHQLKKSFSKYGNYDDAASIWFSGQPLSKAGNKSDGYNTVPQYVKKFRGYFSDYKRDM